MSNYSLVALFIAIICSLCAKGKSYTHSSAKAMEQEIGINWWNVLKAEVTCCPQHSSESDCLNEGGSTCVFFPDPNNEIAQAAGSQVLFSLNTFKRCKMNLYMYSIYKCIFLLI